MENKRGSCEFVSRFPRPWGLKSWSRGLGVSRAGGGPRAGVCTEDAQWGMWDVRPGARRQGGVVGLVSGSPGVLFEVKHCQISQALAKLQATLGLPL